MYSLITEVVGALVLLIMITLMYMRILKLIFGIKADLSKQADILQETLRQVKDLGKKILEPSSDLLIEVHDNEDRVNDWTKRSVTVYSSCRLSKLVLSVQVIRDRVR